MLELRDQLVNSIHWEEDPAALLAYVDGKDWTLDYSHKPAFLSQVRALLSAAVADRG